MEANAARQSLGLSVIIITKNEAARLGDCLASVQFADEIIVLDGYSTDATAEIARAHGAQVHQVADWPGFGPQKNRALALATKPWVLSIDADERVPPELRAEIVRTLSQPSYDGYQIARLSEFCGKKFAIVVGGLIMFCVYSVVSSARLIMFRFMNRSWFADELAS